MHDAQVWGQTQIYQNFLLYLLLGQYFLENAAYTPISFIVSLYKVLEANQVKNTTFNKQFLHICIDIEHIFDILKGRWKSLTKLYLIFILEKKYEFAYM